MITCPACAQSVPESTFCSSCGATLAPAEGASAGGARDVVPIQSGSPRATGVGRDGARRGLQLLSLGLATVWLVASVAAGIWLFTDTRSGAVDLEAPKPSLSSQSTRNFYGGDAFTGIQNAASDTEQAVVEGVNGLADQAEALAEASAADSRELTTRLQQGLAVLIVGVGVLTFTTALSRFADA